MPSLLYYETRTSVIEKRPKCCGKILNLHYRKWETTKFNDSGIANKSVFILAKFWRKNANDSDGGCTCLVFLRWWGAARNNLICFESPKEAKAITATVAVHASSSFGDEALLETILFVLNHRRKLRQVQPLSLSWTFLWHKFANVNTDLLALYLYLFSAEIWITTQKGFCDICHLHSGKLRGFWKNWIFSKFVIVLKVNRELLNFEGNQFNLLKSQWFCNMNKGLYLLFFHTDKMVFSGIRNQYCIKIQILTNNACIWTLIKTNQAKLKQLRQAY